MIIDSLEYEGLCSCGRTHPVTTKKCVIEKGCMKNAMRIIRENGITGVSVAVYDTNTYRAVNIVHPEADYEVILPAEGLHADNHGVALLEGMLPEKLDYLLAIGGGTIHDLTRYCAYHRNVAFVSCPTCASVDGFCSSVCAMTWNGFKKTFTAKAPDLVIADVGIIAEAPMFLTRAGFGDMIGKYVALTDWKLGKLLLCEFFCQRIYDLTLSATNDLLKLADGIRTKDPEAYEKLIYGLLLSGIAMQMLEYSRCASGAEHHISHLIEMNPEGFHCVCNALHGEKVGVGTLIALKEYQRICREGAEFTDYRKEDPERVREYFGERLSGSILNENKRDCCEGLTGRKLNENREKIASIIGKTPSVEELTRIYDSLGLKKTLTDVGVEEAKLTEIMDHSPLVRNRLTLMRLRKALKR